MIIAQRIIRSKGSTAAQKSGKLYEFQTVKAIREWAKRQKKVYVYVNDNGSEGTIRSGRMMRMVDAHVRNVTHTLAR